MTKLEDDQLRWCDTDSISISIRWFVIINKTLIITRSITGESTEKQQGKSY